MSKILSYNKKTTGEGWITLDGQYNADEINMIDDPNGGLSARPRTAIPSPFAQMDLVKNAFRRLSDHSDLQGEAMDEQLVSGALDGAQLFFGYGELAGQLRMVEWDRMTQPDMLRDNAAHRLLGETMEMYLEQDKEAFNFDMMDKLYFLVLDGSVVGSTSPVTMFMATPNAQYGKYSIHVEQNVRLFDKIRQLPERNPNFVKYIYALFTAYPELKKYCGEVNSYLVAAFPLLKPELRQQILSEIGNPTALDLESTGRARIYMESNFTKLEGGVHVLGVPLYGARQEDVEASIEDSDFVIVPTKKVADEHLPLVLQNHLSAPQSDPFRYITRPWDDTIQITPAMYAVAPEQRVLPATTHRYPWLTDDDFFQPVLIRLDYPINGDCFFDGAISRTMGNTAAGDYLLPLKPLFFKYFNVKDLWGTTCGRPRFELVSSKSGTTETVTAILRIPVKKQGQYITLQRQYITANGVDLAYDRTNNRGRFITVPFAVSVFPFVKTPTAGQYKVQLIDRALGMLEGYRLRLNFFDNDGQQLADEKVACRERSMKAEKRVGSAYYSLTDNFEYIGVTLLSEQDNVAATGLLCPRWTDYVPGHEQFTFAVDFGTTNTHVESMHEGDMPQPLAIDSVAVQRLVATSYNGESILYDVIMKQEFLPQTIGGDYGFPQRTVLSESVRLDAQNADRIVALADACLPFIYEKESVGYGNRIVPNLKWSVEPATSKRVKAYLTEMSLLMRTKVLLSNGDLSKTRIVWFYPLAMKVGNVNKLGDMWAKTVAEVFGFSVDSSNLIAMPESVAPYYFYRSSSKFRGGAATVANIDIGGGSSDVVVFESNASQPTLLTSVRFAANVLFGDAYSDVPQGDSNPMVKKYVDYFRRLFDTDDDRYGELNGILEDITSKRKSEDINAFLFSVINNKAVAGNDVFSYNMRLGEDANLKIVFLYFYSALIYYVARMMHHRGLDMPRSVMFSGTGSKVLDIVGSQRDIDLLTAYIFENVYGSKYGSDGFSVVMERREPKQITCRGALMQVRDRQGCENVEQLNRLIDDIDMPMKYVYSAIAKEHITYADMDSAEVRGAVLSEVTAFNDFFLQLCSDLRVTDRFLVDSKSLQLFREMVGKDLEHHLVNGWNFMNRNADDKNDDDVVEDAVFFYPIIGSIRDNLIEELGARN